MKSSLVQIGTRRAVEEWVATHPDQEIPRRVKARIFARFDGKCAITGKRLAAGECDFDHIKRLRDGGEHRELNLQPVWRKAHQEKTAQENSDGAKADRIHAKHFGYFPKSKHPLKSRGFESSREGKSMSRSGYSDDIENWSLIRWRGAVTSALRGKRGQAFLRETLAALDSLPRAELIKNDLAAEGAYCTLGAVGRAILAAEAERQAA